MSSKKSKSPALRFKPDQKIIVHRIAKIKDNRRPSALSKDSSFYDNDDDIIDLISSNDVELSKGSSFNVDPCDVNGVQNTLISSTRKRPTAVKPVRSTNQAVKSIKTGKKSANDVDGVDEEPVAKKPRRRTRQAGKSLDADKMSIYDFDGCDYDEPAKKKSRGRGRRPAQPKKRAKPAPFPRVKQPSVERRENKFTIRAKTPVGESAKALKASQNSNISRVEEMALKLSNVNANQMPLKKSTPREWKNSYATAITSDMDKLGVSIGTHLLGHRQKISGKTTSPKKTTCDSNVVREFMFDISVQF